MRLGASNDILMMSMEDEKMTMICMSVMYV